MRVAFMPLGPAYGADSVVITEFPVILSRSSRTNLLPEAFTVSPYHCEIDEVDGVLHVRDLGSRHGTFVNESRVREACLWPGSKLTVGLNSFFISYSLPERGDTSASPAEPRAVGLQDLPKNGKKSVDIGRVVAFNRQCADS